MRLFDVRPKLGATLAPVADDDPQVYVDLVDAIDVPCLMLVWDDPWFEAGPGICNGFAHPIVTLVAGRVEPGETLSVLETLMDSVIRKLRDDAVTSWGIRTISGPRVFEIGNLSYIAARIALRCAVSY